LSLPIWEEFKLLQMIQFPWRTMVIVSLCSAVLGAAVFETVLKSFQSRLRPIGLLSVGMCIAFGIFTVTQVIRPADYYTRVAFTRKLTNLGSAKSYECWRPVWSREAAFDDREKVSAGDRAVYIHDWDPEFRSFIVAPGPTEFARVATFYYPHWTAFLNGQKVQVSADSNGVILIPLISSEAKVELRFIEPWYVSLAVYISGLVWLILAGILITRSARNREMRLV